MVVEYHWWEFAKIRYWLHLCATVYHGNKLYWKWADWVNYNCGRGFRYVVRQLIGALKQGCFLDSLKYFFIFGT